MTRSAGPTAACVRYSTKFCLEVTGYVRGSGFWVTSHAGTRKFGLWIGLIETGDRPPTSSIIADEADRVRTTTRSTCMFKAFDLGLEDFEQASTRAPLRLCKA